jgi:hypothetical protein
MFDRAHRRKAGTVARNLVCWSVVFLNANVRSWAESSRQPTAATDPGADARVGKIGHSRVAAGRRRNICRRGENDAPPILSAELCWMSATLIALSLIEKDALDNLR